MADVRPNPIPNEPMLPIIGSADYERQLNRRLTDLLRLMALKINQLERRVKELEP